MSEPNQSLSDEELGAFVDGEVTAERAAEIEQWLAADPDAAARVAAWRRQRELIKAALDPVAREPIPMELLRRLRRPAWRRQIWPSAAAAVFAFAVGLGGGWFLWYTPPVDLPTLTLAETGLSAYRVYVGEVRHPVEVWDDEETHLVNWLSKRLDTPLKAPNLKPLGLRLLGGRLVPAVNGEPGAMLMYEGADGERFSIFVARTTDTPTAFRYSEEGDVGAFYWVDETIGYVISGAANRDRLLKVARRVYDELS